MIEGRATLGRRLLWTYCVLTLIFLCAPIVIVVIVSFNATEFIQFPWGDPRQTAGNGAEFVAVDRDGNIYGGEPSPKQLRKYVRVRP